MRKMIVVALCAATLAAVAPGTAVASHVIVTGAPCSYEVAQNSDITGQSYTGVLRGGPVTATSSNADVPPVQLDCSLRVDGATVAYANGSGAGTAAVVATVSFSRSPDSYVDVCTRVTAETPFETESFYYNGATGTWSQNSADFCGPVTLPPVPFYPMGIIDITGNGTSWSYNLNNVFPPTGWTCTTGFMEVSCDPPPPPPGTVNNCRILTVRATNHGLGTVTGNARCLNGASAEATSIGPASSPTVGTSAPGGEFPWRCKVTVIQPIAAPWEVTCTISH